MSERARNIFVPSICFWETLTLLEKGRIRIAMSDPGRALVHFMNIAGFKEAPLTAEIAILSRTLPFNHADPADRFIAATAKSLRLPLATLDAKLKNLAWLETIS
jgi:PIN domain nuclease of toxin-antitoxin system